MTIVTIFRSRLRPGVDADYQVVAEEMSSIARSMDGFIDEKFFLAADGERVTVVRFADRTSQRAWAEQPGHVKAQQRGHYEFYSWYDFSVPKESYHHVFEIQQP
ncbi:MAG TPA: antibiotic biosynthesis monooxygenase [Acidimicrobiales bacterium]|nr:antibiotic biosynthesis monooxygenase [Acidimicrobiales bacterium]